MLVHLLGTFGAALLGGLLPLAAGRSQRGLHLFAAFATGLFLGILFLHLLPETLAPVPQDASLEAAAGALLGTVVALFLIEHLLLPGSRVGDPHRMAGWSTLIGLAIHSFASGFGLAAAGVAPGLQAALFTSIVVHKLAEGFSLTTIFLLVGHPLPRIVLVVIAFALVTPCGVLAGYGALELLSPAAERLVVAVAAGTFLYVALFDLMPEVFHDKQDVLWRLGLLFAGIVTAAMLHRLGE